MGKPQLGPGPGKYLLPPLVGFRNHDPSRYRNPQYTMGEKTYLGRKELGPGPKYHTEYMTPYGKTNPPAYSVVSRPKGLTAFQGPGPAAYNVQTEKKNPAYSMSYRNTVGIGFQTPAPNNYDIPTTLGPKVPDKHVDGAYTMSHRTTLALKEQSPGPARYDPTHPNKYKNKLPQYSMSVKPKGLTKAETPGPSNYFPKLGGPGGYSFGLKTDTSPYITADDEMPCINK